MLDECCHAIAVVLLAVAAILPAADNWVVAQLGDDAAAGTQAAPWKTIQHATKTAAPGDVVTVGDGQYDEQVVIDAPGAEGKLLVLRSQNRRLARVRGFVLKGNGIRIEGFEITSDQGGQQQNGVAISGCRNEVIDNYIHDIPGSTGVNVGGERNRVAGNRIFRMNKGMIVAGKDNLVEGNEIERLIWKEQDADYFRIFGERNIIRRNWLHGTRKEEIGPSHTDGFQTFAVNRGEYLLNITVEGNLLMDFSHQAMMLSGHANVDGSSFTADTLIVRNNVFANGGHIIMAMGIRNLVVTNNTFIGMGQAGVLLRRETRGKAGNALSTGTVLNNIFFDCAGFIAAEKDCSVMSESNLYWNAAKPIKDPTRWSKEFVNTDPLLANPKDLLGPDGKPFTADDGYLLQSASPAMDKGVRTDQTDPCDILGIQRSQGGGWDIGAHEFKP